MKIADIAGLSPGFLENNKITVLINGYDTTNDPAGQIMSEYSHTVGNLTSVQLKLSRGSSLEECCKCQAVCEGSRGAQIRCREYQIINC